MQLVHTLDVAVTGHTLSCLLNLSPPTAFVIERFYYLHYFCLLQATARDTEKLPNEVQLGCYTVSTHPVKAAIERQMKELKEEMLASLRRKVSCMLAINADLIAKAEGAMSVTHALVSTRMTESHSSQPA